MNKRMVVLIVFLVGLLAFPVASARAAQIGPANPNGEPEPVEQPEDQEPVVKKPEAQPATLVDYEAATQRLAQCAALDDVVLRLQCFNRVVEDMGYYQNPVTKEELAKFGFWHATAKNTSTGERTYNMRLHPNAPYINSSGIQRLPELILSCKVNYTEAYIDWKAPISMHALPQKKLDVVYNYDSNPGINARWDLSSDSFAIFIPRAISFIQTMHDKKVLNIQFTPYGEQLVTLTFNLRGLENILSLMYEKCYK
jgi:hypothetical protein